MHQPVDEQAIIDHWVRGTELSRETTYAYEPAFCILTIGALARQSGAVLKVCTHEGHVHAIFDFKTP